MKKWLIERFLPLWAKETVLAENKQLQQENADLKMQIRVLEGYIRGLHRGTKRIIIRGGKEWTS